MKRSLRVAPPMLAMALVLSGCAPKEADYALSEQARNAPAPTLAPTSNFDAPLATGVAAAGRLGSDREALASRAEALRARGAAMSQSAVVDPDARARLEGAVPPVGPAP